MYILNLGLNSRRKWASCLVELYFAADDMSFLCHLIAMNDCFTGIIYLIFFSPLPRDWPSNVFNHCCYSINGRNGGAWRLVRRVRDNVFVGRSTTRMSRKCGECGVSQEEDQILLHEPVREVPRPRTKALETHAADHQDCNNYYPGSTLRCDGNAYRFMRSVAILLTVSFPTTPLPHPTNQLVSFGLSNQMVVKFKEENLMTFKHLFLKDYVDGEMETYALYRQSDVYDHVYYIIKQVTVFSSPASSFFLI